MNWPQITIICLYGIGLGSALTKHGEPRTGNWSFPAQAVGVVVSAAILYFGGFWHGGQ